jgi:8-oxo-dGTP pyrophosphatase MutT (NUDIX family)
MKNFPFKHEDKILWYSRSMAVVGIVFTYIDNEHYFLLNKRGRGVPVFRGKWNIPCGFLDFNESAIECINREVYEECGFEIGKRCYEWKPMYLNTTPNSSEQTISLLMHKEVFDVNIHAPLFQQGGEKDEVEEIRWISWKEIINHMENEMAFNHYEIIRNFITEKNNGFTLK